MTLIPQPRQFRTTPDQPDPSLLSGPRPVPSVTDSKQYAVSGQRIYAGQALVATLNPCAQLSTPGTLTWNMDGVFYPLDPKTLTIDKKPTVIHESMTVSLPNVTVQSLRTNLSDGILDYLQVSITGASQLYAPMHVTVRLVGTSGNNLSVPSQLMLVSDILDPQGIMFSSFSGAVNLNNAVNTGVPFTQLAGTGLSLIGCPFNTRLMCHTIKAPFQNVGGADAFVSLYVYNPTSLTRYGETQAVKIAAGHTVTVTWSTTAQGAITAGTTARTDTAYESLPAIVLNGYSYGPDAWYFNLDAGVFQSGQATVSGIISFF